MGFFMGSCFQLSAVSFVRSSQKGFPLQSGLNDKLLELLKTKIAITAAENTNSRRTGMIVPKPSGPGSIVLSA